MVGWWEGTGEAGEQNSRRDVLNERRIKKGKREIRKLSNVMYMKEFLKNK